MKLLEYRDNLEQWFLARPQNEFPDGYDYVANYKTIVGKLAPIQSEVNAGADFTDNTTLTRHDQSHIYQVIKQISRLLLYERAIISPFEAFHLLLAVQIHDIKNIEGRDNHENNAIEIFSDLGISGILDSRVLKNIGKIACGHAGSFIREGKKEKDKIGYLITSQIQEGDYKLRLQFLAALLRLADEYSDESKRAMGHLLKIGKVKEKSVIHQKHAESLYNVHIKENSGVVYFYYSIKIEDAKMKYPKYIKERDTFEDVYLLDEIFERTVKSHNETVYCMRFLRPDIDIKKISISIELAQKNILDQFKLDYEIIEKGYPSEELNIIDLCGNSLRVNGGYWSGEHLKEYVVNNNII